MRSKIKDQSDKILLELLKNGETAALGEITGRRPAHGRMLRRGKMVKIIFLIKMAL
jgi:hypothetical protein